MSIAALLDSEIAGLLNESMSNAVASANKKKPLTVQEQKEARLLKGCWEKHKPDGMTQESAGVMMGGQTQGAVTQRLNAITRFNDSWLVKFSTVVGFDPTEVRPRVYMDNPELVNQTVDMQLSMKELVDRVLALPSAEQEIFLRELEAARTRQ